MRTRTLVLPFELEPQQGHLQCWAAVAVALERFHRVGPVPTQADFARSLFGERCDRVCAPLEALAHAGLAYAEAAGALGRGALRAELARGHPIPACLRHFIGWHLVVVHGIGADGALWVADPLYGPSVWPYGEFVAAYRGHYAWSHSYRYLGVRPPPAQPAATGPASTPISDARL